MRHEIEPHNGASAGLTADRVQRQSLGSQIAQQLRKDILLGRLPAGSRVSQQRLCETYGTSRMPVRDAIRQLVTEGFVTHTPGGHSIVAPQTATDIEDAFYLEAVVHARATKRATQNVTDVEISVLEHLHSRMAAAESAGDTAGFADLNLEFHVQINRYARSHKLAAALRTVSVGLPRGYPAEFPDSITRANREHAAIIAAIKDRDDERAERLMVKHIAASWSTLARQYFSESAATGPDRPG